MSDHPGLHDCAAPAAWSADGWERRHGSHCACRLLAAAAHAKSSAVDYHFCHEVLQKRWQMTCDHIPERREERVTPEFPAHDLHDPVQAVLIANSLEPREPTRDCADAKAAATGAGQIPTHAG